MRVRLFASLKELAGSSLLEMDASEVGALMDELSAKFGPEFERILAVGSAVVDGEVVGRDRRLGPDDEVALLPPVSGGRQ
jgi:molybdopterin converting factor small subunit